MMKNVEITKFPSFYLRGELVGSRCIELLRELVVSVAAPSDLAESIIVEILHSVEGGDVEQGCSNLKTNLSFCDRSLYLSLVFIYLACFYCFSLYILDIYYA